MKGKQRQQQWQQQQQQPQQNIRRELSKTEFNN